MLPSWPGVCGLCEAIYLVLGNVRDAGCVCGDVGGLHGDITLVSE